MDKTYYYDFNTNIVTENPKDTIIPNVVYQAILRTIHSSAARHYFNIRDTLEIDFITVRIQFKPEHISIYSYRSGITTQVEYVDFTDVGELLKYK